MTEDEGKKLVKGQRIALTIGAPRWTHGRIFTVAEVRSWGVICSAPVSPGDAHTPVGTNRAGYRAAWEHIEAALDLPLAASDLTGNYPD